MDDVFDLGECVKTFKYSVEDRGETQFVKTGDKIVKQSKVLVRENKHYGGCAEKYYTFKTEDVEDVSMDKAYEVEDRIYKKGEMFFMQRVETRNGVASAKYILQKFVKNSNTSYLDKFIGSSIKLSILTFMNEHIKPRRNGTSVKNLTLNPITLTRLHVIDHKFNPTDYFVGKKIDGYTTLITCMEGQLYSLIDAEPFTFVVQDKCDIKERFVLEGEKVGDRYIVHDCLQSEKLPYERRLALCEKLVSELKNPNITTKKIVEVKSVETVKEMESEKCEFETDGLIFTHKEYPAIYKWKPKEMITIDLFCIRVGTQAVVCASKYKH